MFVKYLSIFVLLVQSNAESNSRTNRQTSAELKTALESNAIIPDVVDRAPNSVLEVRYDNGIRVNMGNELKPKSVRHEPSVLWPTEANGHYTLAMVDPDAPSRRNPTSGQWTHWLVVDIPGNDISKGRTLTPYMGSTPPKGSGLHRYVLLVYKQNGVLANQVTRPSSRARFNVSQFAQTHRLGQPVAINFFQAQS